MPVLEGPLTLNDTFRAMVNDTLASSGQERVWDAQTRNLLRPQARRNIFLRLKSQLAFLCEQKTFTLGDELQIAAYAIAMAVSNPIQVHFSTERYAGKSKPKKPKAKVGKVEDFAVIVDREFKIIAWVLPNIFVQRRITAYNKACVKIRDFLGNRLLAAKGSDKTRKSFRWQGFRPGPVLGAGRATLSPGYFMVGHTGPNHPLKQSKDLQTEESQQWLLDVQETKCIIGAISSVICPDMTYSGAEAVDRIRTERLAGEPQSIWPSPFTCIEILVNRASQKHRDTGGGWSMHDILASFGYTHDAVLSITDLQASISFPAGSLVSVLSKVFEHSATWTTGERICIPHFMKDEVHERFEQPMPALPDLGDYISLIGNAPHASRKRKRGME